jgi:muconolactone delta-isomerase
LVRWTKAIPPRAGRKLNLNRIIESFCQYSRLEDTAPRLWFLPAAMEGVMKILAMEVETPGVNPEQYKPHLKPEARRIWELHQSGTIRELYFRADRPEAVLILECADANEAREVLASLPLVQAGLISFDIIPLISYPGFARLFEK